MPDRDTIEALSQGVDHWKRWSYHARGRVSAAWYEAMTKDPYMRGARVVVDIIFGQSNRLTVMTGRDRTSEPGSYQWEPVQVVSGRDGSIVNIHPGLMSEPELKDGLSFSGNGFTSAARSLQVSIDGNLIDPKKIIKSGWPLYGQAEVSLLRPGMDWDQRLIWMRGPITQPAHGGVEDIVTLTISDPVYNSPQIPPWILDTDRWPSMDARLIGERVPIVVNGVYRQECIRVLGPGATEQFLACYGHNFTLDKMFVNGLEVGNTYATFVETRDDLGLPVSLVQFDATAGVSSWNGDNAIVHVRLTDEDAEANGVIQTAKILMDRYGLGPRKHLSERLFTEAEGRLGSIGYVPGSRFSPLLAIDGAVNVNDFLQDLLFQEWPMVAMAWEEDGIGPIVVDHRSEPVARITLGEYPFDVRAEGTRYEWGGLGELQNKFVLRSWYDSMTDTFRRTDKRDLSNNTICAWSQTLTDGEQAASDMESVTITGAGEAAFVLDWWVEHSARPACEVVLPCFPEAWMLLRRGDTVEYSDPAVGFSNEQAVVVERTWRSGQAEIVLRIFPDLINRTGGGSTSF